MSLDPFKAMVTRIESQLGYARPAAWAFGVASFGMGFGGGSPEQGAKILDTWFPVVNLGENHGSVAALVEVMGWKAGTRTEYLSVESIDRILAWLEPFRHDGRHHPNLEALTELRELVVRPPELAPGIAIPRRVVATCIHHLGEKPVDAHDAYLRLHLLSSRKVKPHGLNLDGLHGLLNNVVWTDLGPFDPDTFDTWRLRLRARGVQLSVQAVDKFPRMADYVLPRGVRIGDADRVRLGAYLADGTTVLPEGSCDHNAGTLARSLVDGRIQVGVTLGGADLDPDA